MEILRGSAVMEGLGLATNRWRVAAVRVADGTIFVGTAPVAHPRIVATPFLRGLFSWFLEASSDFFWATKFPLTEELPKNPRRNPISVLMTAATGNGVPLLALYFLTSLAPSSWALQGAVLAIQITAYAIYMLLIRQIEGIARVLQYAGACKKAIWQASAPGTTLRDHPRWHWTSFTVGLTLALAIVAIAAGVVLPHLPPRYLYTWLFRIALMPIVAPIVEELQRLLTKLGHGLAMRVLFAPLIAVDLLGTKDPDEGMLEVATVCSTKLRALES